MKALPGYLVPSMVMEISGEAIKRPCDGLHDILLWYCTVLRAQALSGSGVFWMAKQTPSSGCYWWKISWKSRASHQYDA